jgi:hypothetical protein
MPKNRPGNIKYVTATKAVKHDLPVTELGIVGVAVKQKAVASGQGATGRQDIAIGEPFAIISKGLVEVPIAAPGVNATKGAPVYITAATNALTLTGPSSASVLKFGRCVEVAGERGGRTTHMRVDLDDSDFA